MPKAALFALVGIGFFAHWWVVEPTNDVSPTQSQWGYVLWFSVGIAALALALPLFAGLVGGRTAFRVSFVPAGGAVVSSVANVLEDGLDWGWAFFGFVLGTGIVGLGLVALTAALALTGRGAGRFLSLVPATTLAGIQFYVGAGGVLMLVAWLAAGVVALRRPRGALPTRKSGAT